MTKQLAFLPAHQSAVSLPHTSAKQSENFSFHNKTHIQVTAQETTTSTRASPASVYFAKPCLGIQTETSSWPAQAPASQSVLTAHTSCIQASPMQPLPGLIFWNSGIVVKGRVKKRKMQASWAAQTSLLPKGIWLPQKEEVNLRNRQPRCYFCWVWNLIFMLISCKTGNNTGHSYNLLRGKLARASANEGKFSAQKDLSQKTPFRKTDKHTYLQSKAKPLQSPRGFVLGATYLQFPTISSSLSFSWRGWFLQVSWCELSLICAR